VSEGFAIISCATTYVLQLTNFSVDFMRGPVSFYESFDLMWKKIVWRKIKGLGSRKSNLTQAILFGLSFHEVLLRSIIVPQYVV
jgi:hypothetical protein